MQATVIVSGIPGIGKTTVLRELEAPLKEIVRRRVSDKSRSKDLGAKENDRFDLDWSRPTASEGSVLSGASVRIIRNEEGKQAEAARELLEAMVKRLG